MNMSSMSPSEFEFRSPLSSIHESSDEVQMLNRFCCLGLRTAGVVIGWIGAVLSLISIVTIAIGLQHFDDLTITIYDQMQGSDLSVVNVRNGLILIVAIYLTLNVINLFASVLLVVGTMRDRHLFLVPWLINSGFSLAISVLYFLYFLFTSSSDCVPLLSLFSALVSGGLQCLMWLAIFSLYQKLQRDRNTEDIFLLSTGTSPMR